MKTFADIFNQFQWNEISDFIYSVKPENVEAALNKSQLNVWDFAALVSPEAKKFLPQMIEKSQSLTKQRFGKNIFLYAPLYLSNECKNICTYCGFSFDNKIRRKTLTDNEIRKEAEFLKNKGFEHILIVTGEDNQNVGISYIAHAVDILNEYFANISIEVQPLDLEEYKLLADKNVYAVLVYQETYNLQRYKTYHPKGKKSNFYYRLETPDRIGMAEIHKIGLGVLLGLEDWRVDSFLTALHLDYLQKKYWKSRYSISFPRIRPAVGAIKENIHINDNELIQLVCAYRLFNPDVELSLSTRERRELRDKLVQIGFTTMSAESKTNPGGYVVEPQSLEQFEIDDNRTLEEIIAMLKNKGIEAVMKDWDYALFD
ncbi:MAG: thiamine biosynthesis protein ThiH [Bacteroidia bacterium]|nr:MAG: thiamine biosynthesis protein ThiH [Bacteroidia bacterium]